MVVATTVFLLVWFSLDGYISNGKMLFGLQKLQKFFGVRDYCIQFLQIVHALKFCVYICP